MNNKPLSNATVGFVKIPVSDFARACAFYRDTLGLTEDFAIDAFSWAQYSTGNLPLCLYVPGQGGGNRVPGGETGVQLRVENARAVFEALREHAVGDLNEGDDGSVGFELRDPDGNTIQITQVA